MNPEDLDLNCYAYPSIVERYKGYLLKLANMQAEIRDMAADMEAVSDHLGDNADPAVDAKQVLIEMGSLLADLTVYTAEYEEESVKQLNTASKLMK